MGYIKVRNHPQRPTTIYNHPQRPTTIDNHQKKPPTTTHNHPQPPKNYSKKPRLVTNSDVIPLLMFILKQILSFDSDTKQWYMYMCVCLCEYTWQVITLTIFWLGWLFVFVGIKSNSFDVKSNDFYLLKIGIYELLLINIKQRSAHQSTISAHELHYEFLRILSIFRGNFYWHSLPTVVVDINVETLKGNGIMLSQFAQNTVEARFSGNVTGWDYLLGNWFKIKVSRNLAILLYDCLPINNIYRPKNRILFWSVRQDHGRFEVNLFLIYFVKRTKLPTRS